MYRIPDDDIDRSLPGSKAGSRSDTTGSSHARLASAAFLGLNSSASGNAESQGRTGTATAISSGMSDSDAVPSHTGARFANGIASGMTLTRLGDVNKENSTSTSSSAEGKTHVISRGAAGQDEEEDTPMGVAVDNMRG